MSVRRAIVTLVLSAGSLAACSASGGSPGTSSATASQGGTSAGTGAVVVVAASSSSLGTFLTGPNGMTLYTHAGDTPTSSACTGACATAWPPLTVVAGGQATAGAGVTGMLGTLIRADGTTQVTWQGQPLYYWQSDTKPGDATGDGVNGFSVAKVGGNAPAPSGNVPVPSVSGYPGY